MDKRTVLSIPENTYLYAKIIHHGKERIHAGQQGLAGRKGKGRGSNAAPEGYLLQGAGIGQERRQASHTAEYRHRALHGWTINGKKFDSSRSSAPVAFRLSDLIEGWIIAMQQMCVGDKWEVYIPSEMGYGKFSQPGIPGGSTLIFEIELFGIA